ncbi:MAG: hypothetical protein LBJ94_03970 [Puniceicoccales bacterium]|nr:hypothetical protein [Puniceicoccales bacterium]
MFKMHSLIPLFLLCCVLCGCESAEETYNSKLPWARPAAWEGGRQIKQPGQKDTKPSRQMRHNPNVSAP